MIQIDATTWDSFTCNHVILRVLNLIFNLVSENKMLNVKMFIFYGPLWGCHIGPTYKYRAIPVLCAIKRPRNGSKRRHFCGQHNEQCRLYCKHYLCSLQVVRVLCTYSFRLYPFITVSVRFSLFGTLMCTFTLHLYCISIPFFNHLFPV